MKNVSAESSTRNLWAALGVFAAGLLLVEVNLASRRHYLRWDVSAEQKYTLSDATESILRALQAPTTVSVLLGQGAPHRLELRALLEDYRAHSRQLVVRHVDPDRQAAEYLALTRTISSFEGDEASALSPPAVLIEQGARKTMLYLDDLGTTDAAGRPVSRVEAALTQAIVRVGSDERPVACFVTGHGEPSVEDRAPMGLERLGRMLETSHVEVRRCPLDVPQPEQELAACDLVVLIGPTRTLDGAESEVIVERVRAGIPLLLAVDPLLDRSAQVTETGLEPLAREVGVIVEPAFVLEMDPSLRAPQGMGEAFFAVTKTHPITQGLSTDAARLDARAFFVAATPLRELPGAGSSRLLETSSRADTLSNLRLRARAPDIEPPFALGLASETRSDRGKTRRAVVMGSSNPFVNESLENPSQVGNRRVVEQAFSWLLERDSLVSVPVRTRATAGLRLTEEALSDLLRYVVIILPGMAALCGAVLLWQRHRKQQRSRPQQSGGSSRA